MSGFGERFQRAGYTVPKPLIEVDGKPIIAHVIDLFPGETDFIFICNQEHLDSPEYRMEYIIKQYCSTGTVIGITPHNLGPVHAVLQVINLLDLDKQTIVNYCDFSCYWNWAHFKRHVSENQCDGAIPSYKGFHPHSFGSTYYAYLKTQNNQVIDIQEKQPFTDTPVNEYASSGTYYFASGALVKKYFKQSLQQNNHINGEFYVSLAYKPMFNDKCYIIAYDLQHFMQWGTPQDLAEYTNWSDAFSALAASKDPVASHKGTVLIPMAGEGKRFANEGYDVVKPLIAVSGRSMAIQALRDLPKAPTRRVILRADLPGIQEIISELKGSYPEIEIRIIDKVTDGQARTCMLAIDGLDTKAPLTIGACDNGSLYKAHKFERILEDNSTDIIVWAVRGHPEAAKSPNMFGWLDVTPDGDVIEVSVKKPLSNPATDPIIIGTFTFKRLSDFISLSNRLIDREGKINGEYYIDSLLEDALQTNMRVKIFEVEHYLGWGTPHELNTYKYWQTCFHKWPSHPYRLENDHRVATSCS